MAVHLWRFIRHAGACGRSYVFEPWLMYRASGLKLPLVGILDAAALGGGCSGRRWQRSRGMPVVARSSAPCRPGCGDRFFAACSPSPFDPGRGAHRAAQIPHPDDEAQPRQQVSAYRARRLWRCGVPRQAPSGPPSQTSTRVVQEVSQALSRATTRPLSRTVALSTPACSSPGRSAWKLNAFRARVMAV